MENHVQMQLEGYVQHEGLNEKVNELKSKMSKHKEKIVQYMRENASIINFAKDLENQLTECAKKNEIERIEA